MGQCVSSGGEVLNEFRIEGFPLCDARTPAGAGALDPFEGSNTAILYTIDDESTRRKLENQRKAALNQRPAPEPQQRLFMTVEQATRDLESEEVHLQAVEEEKAAFHVGDIVSLFEGKSTGTVRFVGKPSFAAGQDYIGVELETPTGMNNGTVRGKQYFTCEANHGIFVKPHTVVKVADAPPPPPEPVEKIEEPKSPQKSSSRLQVPEKSSSRKPLMTVEQARRELEEEEARQAASPDQRPPLSPEQAHAERETQAQKDLLDENERLKRELEELKKKHGGG